MVFESRTVQDLWGFVEVGAIVAALAFGGYGLARFAGVWLRKWPARRSGGVR